ncbi:FecR family protein [Draconibacterium mangrovi]|uniref:FecR family protein n=1 Tax=Draconibacterium mangrovi TaxID=2697469 RepID=UPI0013D00544|nr:FecR domain-containing protein [Draconibacterium mangrovi]
MDFNPEILKRYFKGKYSRKDFLAIKSIFEKPEKREEIVDMLQNHWFDYNNEPLPEGNVNHVLDKIHHQINLEKRREIFTGFIGTFQRIAAILIIPLILTFLVVFYYQSNKPVESALAEIQCPMGVRTKFILPDGTTGFLNSGSTLEYPVLFAKNRNVKLSGEAYFEVAHDKAHPFVVKTSNLSTKVLGTQFNVIAYESENREEVVLQEGSVEVYSNQGDKLETLQPDQKLVLNTETGQHNKDNVEASQFVSWTEGKLVFRNESMELVIQRLARWYNVEIEVEDSELLSYAFRATFIDESLDEVLKLMALTAPIKYREEKRETTNDGTYNKKKIIISLDHKREESFK